MTDSYTLIHRMADELDYYRQLLTDNRTELHPLAVEARAALSQPEPEGPTDEELYELWEADGEGDFQECRRFARAVLARWGRPTQQPAEALAARPLLEQVARMGDCIGAHTVAEISTISDRARTWLQENPPGQPVAIEPRGCPTPCACSCVEPAPQPVADGEVGELIVVLQNEAINCTCSTLTSGDLRRAADLLTRLALQPVPVDTRYEFSVMDGDYVEQAGGIAPTLNHARDEGIRYLAQYSQDGPHTLELRRVEILSPDAHVIEPTERTVLAPALQPVADGEVGDESSYLVRELRDWADDMDPSSELFGLLHNAADLLERQHPQPIPVSERLPGAKDCDAEGRCWLGGEMFAPGDPTWVLGFPAWAERFPEVHRFWLPAHALPVPGEAEE